MIVLPIVFLTPRNHQTLFTLLPLLGLFNSGIFWLFTPYFPELFPTRLRATGVAFGFDAARILAAVGPFIAGGAGGCVRRHSEIRCHHGPELSDRIDRSLLRAGNARQAVAGVSHEVDFLMPGLPAKPDQFLFAAHLPLLRDGKRNIPLDCGPFRVRLYSSKRRPVSTR